NEGNGPIPEAVHLIQAARLEMRRHEKQVRPTLNHVSEPFVETDSGGDELGKLAGHLAPEILVTRITRPEDHKGSAKRRQLTAKRRDEINPLRVDHPAKHADEGPPKPRRIVWKAKFRKHG